MFNDYDEIIRIEELCQMLGIGRNKAYKLLNSGALKSFKIGKVHKIPKPCVIEYIKEHSGMI